MQWIIIIICLILVVPTYGISLLFLIWYVFKTATKRRKKILNELILDAYRNNEGEMLTTNVIYYEAAAKFTEENNGRINKDRGNATVKLIIDGEKVSVFFTKSENNELMFSVSNEKLLEERLYKKYGI